MNEFIFEMIIIGIMYTVSAALCINYLIKKRVVEHESMDRMSFGSCLICAMLIGLTILTAVFELVWFMNFLEGGNL